MTLLLRGFFYSLVKANLADYALEKALNGIFHYLAIEEGAIRKDPGKRTTELLKRVFSQH